MNPEELLNHVNPSPDMAAALDRAPACHCAHCSYRRSKPERDHRQRLIQDAQDHEATGPIRTLKGTP